MTTLLGRMLRGVRAGADRGPLSGAGLQAPTCITVTSSAFADGEAMPRSSAGKGVGDNTSPPLRWTGIPPGTRQLVLIIDDLDVPLPRPLLHTVAVLDPSLEAVDAGNLRPGASEMRFIKADLGQRGYAGPRPIPGHGPHHYRFHMFALDRPIADSVATARALLAAMGGHVLARGVLTGTYERPD